MPMEKISRPNVYLTLTAARKKLTLLASQIKILRKKSSRLLQRKRTVAAQEALQRSDVKKFTKELQFIAQRGTLEDKRVMWSYLKDVVHNEYLTEKNDKGKGAYPSRTHTHTYPHPHPHTYTRRAWNALVHRFKRFCQFAKTNGREKVHTRPPFTPPCAFVCVTTTLVYLFVFADCLSICVKTLAVQQE